MKAYRKKAHWLGLIKFNFTHSSIVFGLHSKVWYFNINSHFFFKNHPSSKADLEARLHCKGECKTLILEYFSTVKKLFALLHMSFRSTCCSHNTIWLTICSICMIWWGFYATVLLPVHVFLEVNEGLAVTTGLPFAPCWSEATAKVPGAW